MRFPLNNRKIGGYKFGVQTFYSPFHLGTDYQAYNGDSLFAPEDGEITRRFSGASGGNTIWFKGASGYTYRFLHLSSFVATLGAVSEGKLLGYTGNTGTSTKPHLHLDITNRGYAPNPNLLWQFIDPEKYNWGGVQMNIPLLFQSIWKRPAATGEIRYFERRIKNGSVASEQVMKIKMKYWYGIVYPNGKYSLLGNAKWQLEKLK
mgnify:FL=1